MTIRLRGFLDARSTDRLSLAKNSATGPDEKWLGPRLRRRHREHDVA